MLTPPPRSASEETRLFGVYSAIVVDIKDPDAQGRVKVQLPSLPGSKGDNGYSLWARLCTLMAGNSSGTWFVPNVNDEVLVTFEAGDPSSPFVIGALWNGIDRPPETMDPDGKNERRTLRSRNGVKITFEDQGGLGMLTLETPGGNLVQIKDEPSEITLRHSSGAQILITDASVAITSNGSVSVNASEVKLAAGSVKFDSGKVEVSGQIICDTMSAKSVKSESYTPGAGNIW